MTTDGAETRGTLRGRSPLSRSVPTPLRDFIRTESGSAGVLVAATLAALVWANISDSAYESFWGTVLAVRLDSHVLALDLREWVNSGLMTFFFLVVGLEARREFDMGELRERRRLVLPVVAGLCGMLAPIAIYLAINAGRPTSHGWGIAMSTDTAFALGMLALLGRRFPQRLHTFILTVAVVDDLTALCVIAFAYSEHVDWVDLGIAAGLFAVGVVLLAGLRVRGGGIYLVLGTATWVAMVESGVDPIVVGLAFGLCTYAAPASRDDLEQASGLFRSFREQPTAELEREARRGIMSALSPNERLQRLWHPWTSYVIVPLFALANAGIPITGSVLRDAFTSPVTLGIVFGYVLGKPLGITGGAWLVTRLSRGRLQPEVGWGAVLGGGTIAGVGFTVALLVATLAFGNDGDRLDQAKIGVLTAVVCSFAMTWIVALVIGALPWRVRGRALLGSSEALLDLAVPVDAQRDHVRGPHDALVTLVEYGDFECPYCGQAEPVVRELLAGRCGGDIRYVWRHLPLSDVHPNAKQAAEASEAAAEQGKFWAMHARLLTHQDELRVPDLVRHAEELGLDTEKFRAALLRHHGARRVAEDFDSADLSGVSGTPTFFVNGRRHTGAYDIDALTAVVEAARLRAALDTY